MGSVEERIASLEVKVELMSATLTEVRAVLCSKPGVVATMKDPQTMILLMVVWAASAGGQSFQAFLATFAGTP